MMRLTLLSILLASTTCAHANLLSLLGTSTGGNGISPAGLELPEIDGLDYPNNGTTTALSGVSTTLAIRPGTYTGNVISRTYNWHTVNAPGTSLGVGSSLTINTSTSPALVGQAIEVDETAHGLGGSTVQTSHWFGPIEAAVPVAPVAFETCFDGTTSTCTGANPLSLPTPPQNFLQNGHAIFLGCAIPPIAPVHTASGDTHVWYVDTVGGTTQDAGATGHTKATAFNSLQALFNAGVSGYSGGKLFARTIQPGDTIYIEPGSLGSPNIGSIVSSSAEYSTSDGTSTGTVEFTWVMPDPIATSPVVLTGIALSNGAAGFIFKGFNVERNGASFPQVSAGGTAGSPALDLLFESFAISDWTAHSGDPWLPSHYPNSGGTSDGTIVSASPLLTYSFNENLPTFRATASAHSTQLAVTTVPVIGMYVWSAGYYQGGYTFTPSTGIPNGSKVVAINGLNSTQINWTGLAVNGGQASDFAGLSGLTLNGTVSSTGSMTGTTGYWILATSSTAVQRPYTWNGSAWTNTLGTMLPQTTVTANQAYQAVNTEHLWVWNAGSAAWVDTGTPVLTIGACDPVNDVGTGCPSTPYPGLSSNIPGCDPLVPGVSTGCPSGTVPAYVGTTRAISNELLSYTTAMQVVPAGYWNHLDWAGGDLAAMSFAGSLNTAGSINPSAPNLVQGTNCISVKDSAIREVPVGVALGDVTNSVIYNNKVKWTSQDDFDIFSVHRTWVIHNYMSDPTAIWNHQDAIQLGVDGAGLPEASLYYGASVIENEMYEFTDNTNYFPRTFEGINTTDNTWWNTYVATNIMVMQESAIGVTGLWNVVANNTSTNSFVLAQHQKKVSTNATAPTHNMLANNVSMGNARDISYPPTPCDITNGSLDTVDTNLSIPNVPVAGGVVISDQYCAIGATTGLFNGSLGFFAGLAVASPVDWETNFAGVSPLFKGYHPVSPPSSPNPGWFAFGFQPDISPCVENSFAATGSCAPTDNGVVNLRPNPAFTNTSGTIQATFVLLDAGHVPSGPINGDFYLVQGASSSGTGIPTPPGVWEYTNPPDPSATIQTGLLAGWWFISGTYDPGLIGQGTALGAQMPIADHDGRAWNSPPSIGAYESH